MQTEKVTLYFKQGTSDKVYSAALEDAGNHTFVVNFAYGRRGATLTTGTKTKEPVDYAAAKKIYDKLVKSKTAEGYVPGAESGPYVHTDSDARATGVQPQLLNFIEEAEALALLQDDNWWAQEKFDGKRMLLRKAAAQSPTEPPTVSAINRSGITIGAPDAILQRAGNVAHSFLLDGEAVGERLFAFDLLEFQDQDIRSVPYSQRLAHLASLGLDGAIVVIPTAKTADEKRQLYHTLQTDGVEGIVFKKQDAPYSAGRPNSGGNQRKYKFYDTASVIVTKINDKSSIAVAVYEGDKLVNVGNVTIPPNKTMPAPNAVVEVRYLYAYPGGSLYQPTYLGVRDDIGADDCRIDQLKYKKDG